MQGQVHKLLNHPEFRIRVCDCAIPTHDISWLLRFFERQRFALGGAAQKLLILRDPEATQPRMETGLVTPRPLDMLALPAEQRPLTCGGVEEVCARVWSRPLPRKSRAIPVDNLLH
ncbi:hypothetical protein M3I54_40390 [Paraburkholderia sp. CNPSo 3274]|uniref:hypothetical protein n=1 Tax=Paraburkholderia sp. CNPSo 3274 TaxID=2940932 RepID=UPI0020B8A1F6|nr:hypothetical protein [Paraburkholderia sp. CNPSo 3274]MCP3713072.1 hypothetical protein [Paraburkholderia sp. CNPSo 3274]